MQFKIGQTYSTRSICDYDCIFSFHVVSRTAKTVTLRTASRNGDLRRKVRMWEGAEQCDPFGRYSMSPVLSATD